MCNLKIDWIKINFAEFLQNLESSRISNCENKIIYSRRFRIRRAIIAEKCGGWLWNWCESSAVVKWAEKKYKEKEKLIFSILLDLTKAEGVVFSFSTQFSFHFPFKLSNASRFHNLKQHESDETFLKPSHFISLNNKNYLDKKALTGWCYAKELRVLINIKFQFTNLYSSATFFPDLGSPFYSFEWII